MSFRLRKSFTIGGVKITASKSGVSYSTGCKGFRVTKIAKGKVSTAVSVPGTGISYTSTNAKTKKHYTSIDAKFELAKWIFILTCLFITVIIMLCTYFQDVQHEKWITEERSRHTWITDFNFVEIPIMTYDYYNGEYRCILNGTVKNQSGYDSAGATFIFGLYGENDELIGIVKAYIMEFKNNTNREFKVHSNYFGVKPIKTHVINVQYSLSIE